jgi:hypothetical protein
MDIITKTRFHPASTKGVSAQLTLLTIIMPNELEWDDFETLPEELHLTNVAFEVFQVDYSRLNEFIEKFESRKDQAYDVRGLLYLNSDELKEDFLKKFDFSVSQTFDDGIDIAIIEELRFKIAEFT